MAPSVGFGAKEANVAPVAGFTAKSVLFPATHLLLALRAYPPFATKRTSLGNVRTGETSMSPRFSVTRTPPGGLVLSFHKLGCPVPHALWLVIQTALFT